MAPDNVSDVMLCPTCRCGAETFTLVGEFLQDAIAKSISAEPARRMRLYVFIGLFRNDCSKKFKLVSVVIQG